MTTCARATTGGACASRSHAVLTRASREAEVAAPAPATASPQRRRCARRRSATTCSRRACLSVILALSVALALVVIRGVLGVRLLPRVLGPVVARRAPDDRLGRGGRRGPRRDGGAVSPDDGAR